ncbi:MAG TPA: MFS transporter [Methylomirabilota bacterium]|nr:MFS transporter [Methylomirabilota bacterium]
MTRWIAAAGGAVVSLDSIMNVAFPAIAAAFAEPPERIRWVIVCYVGTYSITAFVGGALADRVGHARVFRAGLVASAVALAWGGLAPTFGWLLAARVLQGMAGGLVYGTAPAIATLGAAPAARGRALGFLNAGIGVGFTIGPLVAGVLVEHVGWRAIFHVRVPLALAVFAWALVGLPAARGAATRLVAAADVLRRPVLVPGALSFVANASIFSVWLLAPFYLVLTRGLDAATAGLLFTLTPLGTALAAPVAGRAGDRFGARGPMVVGLALQALGLFLLSRADATTGVAVLTLALFAAGFGLGLFQVPNMAQIMGAFSGAQQGAAGGFAFLARTLGIVTGVLVLAGLFAARRASVGLQSAFGEAFLIAAAAVAVAAVAATAGRRGQLRV